MTSPFGLESISSTVAEIAAVSPTLTTVTVTSTMSPSYGGTGLTTGFAGRRSGPNCARTGLTGFAPAMRSVDAMRIPKRITSPPRRPRGAEGGTVRDRSGTPRKDDDHGGPEGTPSAPERRRRQGRPSPRAVPERPPPHWERAGVRPE